MKRASERRNKIITIFTAAALAPSMRVRAAVAWTGILEKWGPVYTELEPWVTRFALLLAAAGFMEAYQGYSTEGAYGLSKGIGMAVGGFVLIAVWNVLKRIYA